MPLIVLSDKRVRWCRPGSPAMVLAATSLLFLGVSGMAHAQVAQQYWLCRVPSPGVEAGWCPVSASYPLPVAGAFTPSGTQHVDGTGTAGAPAGGVVTVQGAAGGTPQPTTTSPGARTLVTLDVKTVTTGGTAVTAILAGHRTAGGFLQNPVGAAAPLCINEIGTATGTTSAGDTTCIMPGQSYTLSPTATAVSVIASDSAHAFSGYGLQ